LLPSDVLPLDIHDAIVACIKAELSGIAEMKGTIDILRQIAIARCFALLEASDPRSELIFVAEVGTVVIGVSKSDFGGSDFALVPVFQVVR
jgi:hypothetical protein